MTLTTSLQRLLQAATAAAAEPSDEELQRQVAALTDEAMGQFDEWKHSLKGSDDKDQRVKLTNLHDVESRLNRSLDTLYGRYAQKQTADIHSKYDGASIAVVEAEYQNVLVYAGSGMDTPHSPRRYQMQRNLLLTYARLKQLGELIAKKKAQA